jgi:hypothetical protein
MGVTDPQTPQARSPEFEYILGWRVDTTFLPYYAEGKIISASGLKCGRAGVRADIGEVREGGSPGSRASSVPA